MAYQDLGAGDLNRRITIQRRTDYPAEDMGLDSVLTLPRDRWAKIEPVGTAVYANGVQTDNKITHRVFVRYLQGVTVADEIASEGCIYAVRRVAAMNGGRRFTVLEVEELGFEQPGGSLYG
ncbi:phage head closure protein [Pseudomonas sp. W2-17]|uniref:phage head closure protein n=1 Tax=Pseudomonas sp. W2-17 TaxID=3058039 RepID=UPI0034E0BFAD